MKSASLLVLFGIVSLHRSNVIFAQPATKDEPKTQQKHDNDRCTMFLGPSIIKEKEGHGFGLGMFTGVKILEGTMLVHDETLIPLFDSATLNANHPPLREYVWHGNDLPELSIGSSDRNAFWFAPGLASIAPCTTNNFNLQLWGPGTEAGNARRSVMEDLDVPHRSSPSAGSYTYKHSLNYIATRDIDAGEELVVQCADDDFDGHSHRHSKFDRHDPAYICLDNVAEGGSRDVGGKGLFSRKHLAKGDNIISSPLIPIHRKEFFGDGTGKTAPSGLNAYQLAINYAFGHEDSDLLLLPYGPLVTYINHPPPGKKANAIIKWHPLDKDDNTNTPRRQQYHHPELFDLPADQVAETHGKGLMIDIVALEDIAVGAEIYLDYGESWTMAWENHEKRWKPPADANSYESSDAWFRRGDSGIVSESYPDNLMTVCFYDNDAHVVSIDEENGIVNTHWQQAANEAPHECLRPCNVIDRYYDEESDELLYKAEMLPFEGAHDFCILDRGKHIASDVSFDAIMVVDKPYTTDTFLEQAFRHEIGVPDDFYPKKWLRKKVRRRPDEAASFERKKQGAEFKLKGHKAVSRKAMLDHSPRNDL